METFLEGWKSGAAAENSVFRKCEYDWTTVSVISQKQTIHYFQHLDEVTTNSTCSCTFV